MFLVSIIHSSHRCIFKNIARVPSDLAGLSLFRKVTLILWVTLLTVFMRETPELQLRGYIRCLHFRALAAFCILRIKILGDHSLPEFHPIPSPEHLLCL